MFDEKRLLSLINAGRVKRETIAIGMDRFQKPAASPLDLLRPRSISKTKSLVGYLLGNSSRANRAVLPRVAIRLRVITRSGGDAVKIYLH